MTQSLRSGESAKRRLRHKLVRHAGLWDGTHVAAWRRVTELVHREGSTIAVQLAHAGRTGSKYRGLPGDAASGSSAPTVAGGWRTVGATGVAFGRYDAPNAAKPTTVEAVIDAFGSAARRADDAGFDTTRSTARTATSCTISCRL
ncbi:hypothetical protein HQQ80_15605 [Microbacteriaceae bacterium VKM Ac-2855]|nr:hypothetical protein [Microbacteriaceae bacterium VKM Ac-2855]